MRRLGPWLHLVVPFAALALALALHVRAPRFVENLRFQVFDAYQRLSPRPNVGTPVIIVDIDDASLSRIGQWPWPRTRIAELVRKLHDAGTAVIGMDIILAEPDLTSPENVIPLWGATDAVARIRDAVEHLPEHDAVLADAVRHAPVVTGFALTRNPNAVRPPRPYTIEISGPSPLPVLPEFAGAVANLPRIDAGARGVGGFNFLPARRRGPAPHSPAAAHRGRHQSELLGGDAESPARGRWLRGPSRGGGSSRAHCPPSRKWQWAGS